MLLRLLDRENNALPAIFSMTEASRGSIVRSANIFPVWSALLWFKTIAHSASDGDPLAPERHVPSDCRPDLRGGSPLYVSSAWPSCLPRCSPCLENGERLQQNQVTFSAANRPTIHCSQPQARIFALSTWTEAAPSLHSIHAAQTT